MTKLASPQHHPLDPLSLAEISLAIATVRRAHGDVFFNVVSLHEPRKAELLAWRAESTSRPPRVADVVVIAKGGKVYDGLVDVESTGEIVKWECMDGVQPIVRPPRESNHRVKADG